ncbi:MAG: hypothetical protein KAV82_16260, partial [Phycisphaerae bacterium]|nr:hypothetical protein [Phycisphaerae bacterium]
MMRCSPIAIVIVTLITAAAQARTILYVDDSSTSGANDGSSWCDAFVYLQDALSEAATNGLIEEIRVGRGTYRPDEFAWPAEGTGEREAGFGLLDGVA